MHTHCTSGYGIWESLSNNRFVQWRHSIQASKMTALPKEGRYICLPFIHIQTLPILSQPFLLGTGPPFSSQEEGKTSYCSPCEGELAFPLLLMSSWLVAGGKRHLYFPPFCLYLFAGSQKVLPGEQGLCSVSGLDQASQRPCLGWRFLLSSHLIGIKVDRGQLWQWCRELPMETRLRPNTCVFFSFLMLRIWPFMHFSVYIAEAPHFSPLFELNLEARWATIQQTAHEHSLKIWSKHICPADTVVQQKELAGCQFQPWNPTVVIKKLIKRVNIQSREESTWGACGVHHSLPLHMSFRENMETI